MRHLQAPHNERFSFHLENYCKCDHLEFKKAIICKIGDMIENIFPFTYRYVLIYGSYGRIFSNEVGSNCSVLVDRFCMCCAGEK